MTEQNLMGLLFALKCTSFFFAFWITFRFVCTLSLKVIEACAFIYHKKSWKVDITGNYIIGIPVLWSIFYFLCNAKG